MTNKTERFLVMSEAEFEAAYTESPGQQWATYGEVRIGSTYKGELNEILHCFRN